MISAAVGVLLWSLVSTAPKKTTQSPPPPNVEVIGRLTNLSYEPRENPDDLLGHGWVVARLDVSKILRGRLATKTIIVRYLAHTYRAERAGVRFKLRAAADGTYTVCAEPGTIGLVCG